MPVSFLLSSRDFGTLVLPPMTFHILKFLFPFLFWSIYSLINMTPKLGLLKIKMHLQGSGCLSLFLYVLI